MSARRTLLVAAAFTALTAVACLCSYSLTRTSDAFAWWLSTALVVLGVAYTGLLEHLDADGSWSGRRYGTAFMALMIPVILISAQAGTIVGASVIGSRSAVAAAQIAHAVWRRRRPR